MKGIIHVFALTTLSICCTAPIGASAETLIYKVTMRLQVPRVYDNTQSLGYRKPQRQIIVGYVSVDKDMATKPYEGENVSGEPEIYAYGFYNKTHKVAGSHVTYADCALAENVMWRYIGNNKTCIFKKTCIKFNLDLNPSYNIGADEPDNTLVIQLSGIGNSEKLIQGSVTGQIGCGCFAYGHISPTRDIQGNVQDITPLYGRFVMKLKNRIP